MISGQLVSAIKGCKITNVNRAHGVMPMKREVFWQLAFLLGRIADILRSFSATDRKRGYVSAETKLSERAEQLAEDVETLSKKPR